MHPCSSSASTVGEGGQLLFGVQGPQTKSSYTWTQCTDGPARSSGVEAPAGTCALSLILLPEGAPEWAQIFEAYGLYMTLE